MKKILLITSIVAVVLTSLKVSAQDTPPTGHNKIVHPAPGSSDPDHSLAAAAANPLADMISVPIQNNFNFNVGPDERFQYNVNLQPVIPYHLNKKGMVMINRVIVPILVTPTANGSYESGMAPVNWTMYVVPKPTKLANGVTLTWGAGPVLSFGMATNPNLGTNEFSIGANALAVFGTKHIMAGALIGYTVSYLTPNVSNIFAQYFFTYNIKKGWFVTSAPNWNGNLKAPEGSKWVLPIGIGGGRVTKIGKQPIKWVINGFYNTTTPNTNYNWSVQGMFVLLFPKKPS